MNERDIPTPRKPSKRERLKAQLAIVNAALASGHAWRDERDPVEIVGRASDGTVVSLGRTDVYGFAQLADYLESHPSPEHW